MKRKWSLEDEQNKQCIEEVITRIEEIDGDKVGLIAAQDIIDIVSQHVGPKAYNAALEDAKKLLQTRMEDVAVDIDLLEQR